MQSNDPAIHALLESASTTARLKWLATSARLPFPYTAADLRQFKTCMQKEELKRWSAQMGQGQAVDSLAGDKLGNSFLYDPTLLKPCRFITALQLRTNTTGNRTSLNRAVPQADLNCHKSVAAKETLAHILGQCTFTKALTIRHHNEVHDLIMDKAMENDKAAEVTKEPELPSDKGKLKPDLVMKNQAGVFVVDGDYLKVAKLEKEIKYGILLSAMQRERAAPSAEALPIFGTRGAMPADTIKCLDKLGYSKAPSEDHFPDGA
ncbi:uncharacterized protein LOC110838432 [Zootermopsis nevadensis]|uniref:uncharacterized protein LOC110838432 n=1 Tax=Zootermopsis nevadensis TaxID=136037 RepID=UPI000B8EAF3B|nr:uncharacterized protein LOC110838432 [Zootermopsis nevadensis]